ncbi:hypothetical protein [Luteimonas terrae]|uniref:Lipoprotein n=1 Tax=Luteimonas terrae TaxID=1530191 RepID=A0ABU1XT70_9GAMM|nr:hypothetical protein [Luteimonas terrae]MDR7191933.1 hypothetical protein [Luteimonas terrae]
MRPFTVLAAAAACLLGGCFFEPSASGAFSMQPGTPSDVVFKCVEATIRAQTHATWEDVTLRDGPAGVLETGDFASINRMGVRVRVRYDAGVGKGSIQLKASGPYFADLGADTALATLLSAPCLTSG